MSGRLTDAAIRMALTPAQDAVAPLDFASTLNDSIRGVRQRPRRRWTDLSGFRQLSSFGRMLIIVLLLFGLLLGILLAGSLRQQGGPNGLLLVATGDRIQAIDVNSGLSSNLVSVPGIFQVTRSPDGQVVSFWTRHGDIDWLEVIRPDDGERRRVAAGLDMLGAGCIDQWSPDSTALAVRRPSMPRRRPCGSSWSTWPDVPATSPRPKRLRHVRSGPRMVRGSRSRRTSTAIGMWRSVGRDGSEVRDVSGNLEDANAKARTPGRAMAAMSTSGREAGLGAFGSGTHLSSRRRRGSQPAGLPTGPRR